MKKLVTVAWSFSVEVDLPDSIEANSLMNPTYKEIRNRSANVLWIEDILKQAGAGFRVEDCVITDVQEG